MQRTIHNLRVSTRAPAKGATLGLTAFAKVKLFQLALPRKERLFIKLFCVYFAFVSTRAPAKGATDYTSSNDDWVVVSTRAPAKGATTATFVKLSILVVSTRAPAKGATYLMLPVVELRLGFNSRSRERSDMFNEFNISTVVSFNSRSRERSDKAVKCGVSSSKCFNSRSRERSDL